MGNLSSLNFSKKDLVLTLGKTPRLRLVKHQNRLSAKVIGYLSQEALKTNPQQDSLFSVIREGPDGLQQLLLLSVSQSSWEAMTPRSSFTNRITATYYLCISNLQVLMLPSSADSLSCVPGGFPSPCDSPNTPCCTSQVTARALTSLDLPVHTAADQMTTTPGKTESAWLQPPLPWRDSFVSL